jgi:hypothetical protein
VDYGKLEEGVDSMNTVETVIDRCYRWSEARLDHKYWELEFEIKRLIALGALTKRREKYIRKCQSLYCYGRYAAGRKKP